MGKSQKKLKTPEKVYSSIKKAIVGYLILDGFFIVFYWIILFFVSWRIFNWSYGSHLHSKIWYLYFYLALGERIKRGLEAYDKKYSIVIHVLIGGLFILFYVLPSFFILKSIGIEFPWNILGVVVGAVLIVAIWILPLAFSIGGV